MIDRWYEKDLFIPFVGMVVAPCFKARPQIFGLKSGFKSLSQLLEADVKTRSVHQLLDIHVQASLQTVF